MKMKLLKRSAIMATSALGVLGVLFTMLETFGVRVFRLFNIAAASSVVVLLLIIIVLVALAGLCAYSFYLAFNGEKAYKARMVTLKGTDDDVVLIKQETLDDFVKSVIGKPEGVTDISVATQYRDMSLDVTVTLAVNMDTDIANATANMQAIIREQLEVVNGIRLSGVTVIISGINVPENTEGMKMPWADKKEEAEIKEKTEEITSEAAEETAEAIEEVKEEASEEIKEAAEEIKEAEEETEEAAEENADTQE